MSKHANDNLQHYPLPAPLASYLRRVDQDAQTRAREGLSVEATITLHDSDYLVVDRIVRYMSDSRHNASTVTWNGRPLQPRAVAVAA